MAHLRRGAIRGDVSEQVPTRVATATRSLVLVLASAWSSAVLAAVPPDPIPPGASPGGAMPRDRGQQPLPVDDGPMFDIPPVYQRPIGVEEGERIFVEAFEITGITEDPELGISRAAIEDVARMRLREVQELVEQLRRDKQQLDSVGPNGFTASERDRMAAVLGDVLATQDPEQQAQKLQALVTELRFSRFDRSAGLTIGQLQQVADGVTQFYRDRGFFLARAIVPAQEVQDGVVEIRVLEGRFGKAVADGNKRYKDETLTEVFKELEGEIVTEDKVVSPLLRVNDLPGVNATGVFRPGEEVGTSDLVLNVQRERAVDWSIRLDDHISEFTGDFRFIGELSWNNPIGGGDRLDMQVLKSFRPEDSTYGSIAYSRQMSDPSWRWKVIASRNRFDVSNLQFVNLGGVSEVGTVGFDKTIARSRFENWYGSIELQARRAEILENGEIARLDKLTNIGFQLAWDSIDREARALSSGYVRIDHGLPDLFAAYDRKFVNSVLVPTDLPDPSRISGNNEFATSQYVKLSFDWQRLKTLSSQAGNQTIFFRFNGQYSPDLLTSLDQYSVGGPNNMRAMPVSSVLVDSAITGTFEWTIRAPGFSDKPVHGGRTWGQVLSLTAFYDRTMGYVNDPLGSEQHRYSFGGPGLALGLDFGSLYMRAMWARLRIGDNEDVNDSIPSDRESQLWFELTYTY